MLESLRLDASLGSIILIVLISSALLVFSFAREDIDSPVVVLKNTYPEKMFSQASVTTRKRMDFSFTIAARREINTLEIQYVTLVQLDPVFLSDEVDTEASLEDMAEHIAPVKALLDESENGYLGHEKLAVKADFRNRTYDGLFVDFRVVRYYAWPENSDQIVTSFLILDNGTGILYFEGVSDFYVNRLGRYVDIELPKEERNRSSIDVLRIRRNENVTAYSSDTDAPEGWLPIEEVPEMGRVVFKDVEKHDTFSIDFTIETARRPAGMSAHLIRTYADGELVDTRVNLVE